MSDVGYIYVITNEIFPKNVYKCGYTVNKEGLLSRYNTYYPTDIKIEYLFKVSNCKLAEALLFHKLDQFRMKQNKEFFECDLSLIKKECLSVVSFINNGNKLAIDKCKKDIKDLENKRKRNAKPANNEQNGMDHSDFINKVCIEEKGKSCDFNKYYDAYTNYTGLKLSKNEVKNQLKQGGYTIFWGKIRGVMLEDNPIEKYLSEKLMLCEGEKVHILDLYEKYPLKNEMLYNKFIEYVKRLKVVEQNILIDGKSRIGIRNVKIV